MPDKPMTDKERREVEAFQQRAVQAARRVIARDGPEAAPAAVHQLIDQGWPSERALEVIFAGALLVLADARDVMAQDHETIGKLLAEREELPGEHPPVVAVH